MLQHGIHSAIGGGKAVKLYLFGPMRGYPDGNGPAFKEAREALRDMKHEVFCPWEFSASMGWPPTRRERNPDRLRHLMMRDFEWIVTNAEGLVGLEGWPKSKGSLAEVHLAWAIGLPVYEYELFVRRIIREVKNVPEAGS